MNANNWWFIIRRCWVFYPDVLQQKTDSRVLSCCLCHAVAQQWSHNRSLLTRQPIYINHTPDLTVTRQRRQTETHPEMEIRPPTRRASHMLLWQMWQGVSLTTSCLPSSRLMLTTMTTANRYFTYCRIQIKPALPETFAFNHHILGTSIKIKWF